MCVLSHSSHVQSFVTLWTAAPLSMGFSSKTTGVGCYFILQGNLPDSEIEPTSLISPALAGSFFTTSTTCTYNKTPTLSAKLDEF